MKEAPYFKIQPKTNRYAYLWLKYVRAFNPKVHCTGCLIGHFSQIIPFRKIPAGTTLEGLMDEVNYKFAGYLCGVSDKYDDNLHIAFKYQQGSTITYENKLVIINILNAVQLPIMPITDPIDKGPEYLRCRNYQWAWNYFGVKKFGEQAKLHL